MNDLATLRPEVAREWSAENQRSPHEVTEYSTYTAKWVCEAGHEWSSPVFYRTSAGTRCEQCSNRSSAPEQTMRRMLHISDEWHFSADSARLDVRWGIGRTPARVDSVGTHETGARLVVEYDGNYWHQARLSQDADKTGALVRAGYLVARIREQVEGQELPHFDTSSSQILMVDVSATCWRDQLSDVVQEILDWGSTMAMLVGKGHLLRISPSTITGARR